jgi:hypothetical protein
LTGNFQTPIMPRPDLLACPGASSWTQGLSRKSSGFVVAPTSGAAVIVTGGPIAMHLGIAPGGGLKPPDLFEADAGDV